MDLIIILISIIAVAIIYKKFQSVVYYMGILEIFFHTFVNHLKIVELTKFVRSYIPSSFASVLAKYSSGLLYDIFVWVLIILFAIFEFFLIKSFIKRKK